MFYLFCWKFIVGAKIVEIIEFPQSLVKEGTTAVFKCSSDEGNPPPLISWNQGTGTSEVKFGRFHAFITESTLHITVGRTMNQKEIVCYIEKDSTKGQKKLEHEVILSVKCESFFLSILSMKPWFDKKKH